MKLVNVTPHKINVHCLPSSEVVEIEPSGTVARVATSYKDVPFYEDIPFYSTEFGEIEDLPEPQDDVIYIASLIIASRAAAQGRTDVVSPGPLIRDCDTGQPVGCKGLVFPPK